MQDDKENRSSENSTLNPLILLIFPGSFSPVHSGHVTCMEVAKLYLGRAGLGTVVGGWFIPSSDRNVKRKLGDAAISLLHRNEMLRLVAMSSDWLNVYEPGARDGFEAAETIKRELEHFIQASPHLDSSLAQRLQLWILTGADFADNFSLFSAGRQNTICIARGDKATNVLRQKWGTYLADNNFRKIQDMDRKQFVLLDESGQPLCPLNSNPLDENSPGPNISESRKSEDSHPLIEQIISSDPDKLENASKSCLRVPTISSTWIRHRMLAGTWAELLSSSWLPPGVSDYLQHHQHNLTDRLELLVETTSTLPVALTQKPSFPAKHGVFLTVASNQPETFNTWKPIACSLLGTSTQPGDDLKVDTCVVQVAFASLNFRDVMVGTSRLERSKMFMGHGRDSGGLGLDFAGFVHSSPSSAQEQPKATQVIGLGCNCIASTLPRQPKYLCWELEDHCDLEKFATIPCAYATAYYALCVHGRLQKHHKVLIHCGTGGVGQAALHVCKRRLENPASQLFVTGGTHKKRSFLCSTFEIPERNIGDSRSCEFKNMVLKQTNGKGVDLVLNSLAGDLVEAGVACLSFGGTLLELGKTELPPSILQLLRRDDRHLAMIDLDQVMAHESRFMPVQTLLAQGLKSGEVKPLSPSTVFGTTEEETKKAFQSMSCGERIGKVVLRIEQESLCCTDSPLSSLVDWAQFQRIQHVIVIVGGFGGLGLCLSQLFAARFGRTCQLVLCTRQQVLSPVQQQLINSLCACYGVKVKVFHGDLSQLTEAARLLESVLSESKDTTVSPPFLWLFNAAAAMHDTLFENMISSDWDVPFQSKVAVTNSLFRALDDERFADVAACLKLFVCFSSVVTGEGNKGQTNYAAANGAMEQIIRDHIRAGEPVVCVRLGLLQYTGLATSVPSRINCNHLRPLRVQSALLALERLFTSRVQGIYTLYGPEAQDNPRVSHKDVEQSIFALVREFHPGTLSADNGLLNKTLDTILDSFSTVVFCSKLRELLDSDIEPMPDSELVRADALTNCCLLLWVRIFRPFCKGDCHS